MTNRPPDSRPNADPTPFRFSIAATFTAEPLRPVIAFWARQLHADFDIRFAPYNQVLQTLADPAGDFRTNGHGVNIVLVRLDDLGQFRPGENAAAQLEANVEHLVDELRAAPSGFRVPLLVCLCPSAEPAEPQVAAARARLAATFQAGLQGVPGLLAIDEEEVARLYPVEQPLDPEGDRLGRIPYTEAYFCALGTALVRFTDAVLRQPFKVIALDCDNTLWRGICGEDGPEGVVLDAARRELHEFMLRQRSAGMLLTLASKNNEEDVLETFRVHPEMPLQPRHFVTWRLNWASKAANLASIAGQLNLGLDSFLFVDDNPKECAEVEQGAPAVQTLVLPEEESRIPHFLQHVWAFDHPIVTAEDRNRSAYYEQVAGFGNEIRRASSLEEFMASLNLRVTLTPLSPSRIPRAAQLTQRTNQFNLTGVRRTEAEIASLASEHYECFTAEVSDRFGDYGVVGLLIARVLESAYQVDTMLLSCRVLGRGVEHRLLAFAGARAAERGIPLVEVPYRRTAKNQPARQFLESIGFGERAETPDGFVLRLPSAQLSEWKWSPAANGVQESAAPAPSPVPTRRVDYARIARELSSVSDILAAMRRQTRGDSLDHSLTETERQLAGIWSDLLETPLITADSNFFDLGGHSLLAVLLLLRIREAFGVELSIDDVYSGSLTLSALAARIEAAQLGDLNPDEYAALLAEIENMTDEEAREMLARENRPEA